MNKSRKKTQNRYGKILFGEMLCFLQKNWEKYINHLDCRLEYFAKVAKKPVFDVF